MDPSDGTSQGDRADGLAVDATGVYVIGVTNGTFSGQVNAGGEDIFVSKFGHDGNSSWTRQLGTSSNDLDPAIAVFGDDVLVTGNTLGVMAGSNAGSVDFYLVNLDASTGADNWVRHFGGLGDDYSEAVAADATGIYVVGSTSGPRLPGTGLGNDGLAFGVRRSWTAPSMRKLSVFSSSAGTR